MPRDLRSLQRTRLRQMAMSLGLDEKTARFYNCDSLINYITGGKVNDEPTKIEPSTKGTSMIINLERYASNPVCKTKGNVNCTKNLELLLKLAKECGDDAVLLTKRVEEETGRYRTPGSLYGTLRNTWGLADTGKLTANLQLIIKGMTKTKKDILALEKRLLRNHQDLPLMISRKTAIEVLGNKSKLQYLGYYQDRRSALHMFVTEEVMKLKDKKIVHGGISTRKEAFNFRILPEEDIVAGVMECLNKGPNSFTEINEEIAVGARRLHKILNTLVQEKKIHLRSTPQGRRQIYSITISGQQTELTKLIKPQPAPQATPQPASIPVSSNKTGADFMDRVLDRFQEGKMTADQCMDLIVAAKKSTE